MGKRILFSPVGGTDPIKYQRDGSLLHICRVYKPDEVYLYLSYEMLKRSQKDNRYCKTIQLLGEKLNHKFEIHLIEREGLVNAQRYDFFYKDFRNEINKIREHMDETDELVLNMASGTPAMKSALMVIATLTEYQFRAIQVDSPNKASNEEYEERNNYDIELNWEYNLDNEECFENRCEEVQCFHLMHMLKIEAIKKHLTAYDYPAALSVAKEIERELNPEAILLLKVANERVKLNRSFVNKTLPKGDPYGFFPVKEGNKQKIFEYVLVLQMKVNKEEYADFIRGITPVVVDLLENILKIKGNIDINEYCTISNADNIRKWDRSKLDNTEILEILNRNFNGIFRYGPVFSSSIATLILEKCEDLQLKEKVQEILAIEGKLRNMAAHEIVSVTNEWFKKNTGKSANEILELIKYLLRQAGIHNKKEDWLSYDVMNEKIIEMMDKYLG